MEIVQAQTSADFEAAHALIMEMADWDAEMTRSNGIVADELIARHYGLDAAELQSKFSAPGTGMLLALIDGIPGGCIAFAGCGPGTAEIHKLFVRPACRGRGAARALMAAGLAAAREASHATARLETVTFMKEAIALYRSFDFEPCPPYQPVIPELAGITLFFRRAL